MPPTRYLSTIIHLVIGLAEAILFLRIILRLFAANPSAPFVNWVYSTSGTLLQPFRGIFPSTVVEKSYVLDFTALFALVIYGFLGSLLMYFVKLLEDSLARPRRSNPKK